MQFRKDINGLRAIAVIAVVLFHFNNAWLPGGFAGVDVFFVISGFLMTGIIFRGLEQGNFSILKFYVARANRIIPALAILCLAILVLGYLFLTSWDYKTIGRDIATSMFFVSSIMYSLRNGYFDTGDNFLLHTWSLSTEWQFYVIYPILLAIMHKFMSFNAIKKMLLFVTLIGFIFSIIATYKWPTASYYLLPMRAWEMMVGGLAYLLPFTFTDKRKKITQWIGLLLIISSYLIMSKESLWPGYLAILPVLGTFLIIQAQRNNSYTTSNIVFQKIGLWSYSIYLWHWPIAASFSYYSINDQYKILGILLSILLGFLSYHFFERKIKKVTYPKKAAVKYISIMVIFGLIGSLIFKTQGFAQRESLVSNPLIQGGTTDSYLVREGESLLNTTNKYDYILIGDSNSNHYLRGIIKEGSKIKHSWYPACLSFPNSLSTKNGMNSSWKVKCGNNYKFALNQKKDIIIAQNWDRLENGSLECKNKKCQLTGKYSIDLKYQLAELLQAYSNNNVYLIGELPKPRSLNVIKCLKTNSLLGLKIKCDRKGKLKESATKINTILKAVTLDYKKVTFIDPTQAICLNGLCNYSINEKSVFMTDGGHLSGYGSEFFWNYIINKINQHKKILPQG